ncbi:GRIP and coiled-coil domain-containing protein 1, partial [Stegodyphus mimosarum]
MEKKSKKELIALVEEQSKCLQKYKSRLHDVVESYKHLVKEKEALEKSIKALTEARSILTAEDDTSETDNASGNDKHSSEKRNDDCLQMLRSSLEALTVEKARIENELRTDRKKILQQKDELERTIVENENNWFLEREKFETIIQELKKKISAQQREREKEQQDHAIMLKELQNLLANERALKDKLEEQISDLQQRFSSKLSEKKAVEYEKSVEELQYKLKASQDRLQISENKNKENGIIMQKLQKDLDDIKVQYLADVDAEKSRADMAEERLKLLTIVNEKRIANLESRISELSSMVGNYDKLRQDDQLTIQRLK